MRWTARKVGTDRRLRRVWVDVATRRHADDPWWVPPLRSDALKGTDPRHNPFFRHAEVEHFVLFGDGEPVGRVAATVYPPHLELSGRKEGFFGFLSCLEDPDAFKALLSAVEGWLTDRGMRRVVGPYSYFIGQEMGVRTQGFESPPAMFQSCNPPTYRDLLGQCGYKTDFEVGTYTVANERLSQATRKAQADSAWIERLGLVSRSMDPKRFDDEMELVRRLFNASFAGNQGVLPYERDVFEDLVGPLRRFVDPTLIRFLERNGEPVAFCVTAPDVNPILQRLNGSIGALDLLRMPKWQRSLDAVVLLLVGVLPDQPMGVGPALLAETLKALEVGGYRTLHTTWVHQDNTALEPLILRFCGKLRFATRSEIVFKELSNR